MSIIIFAIFLTSIQHICIAYPGIDYNIYVDDIELYSNIDSTDQLHNCITVNNWLTNILILNSTKTELINISTAKINTQSAFPKIFINDIPITSSDPTKYLGIEFDIS